MSFLWLLEVLHVMTFYCKYGWPKYTKKVININLKISYKILYNVRIFSEAYLVGFHFIQLTKYFFNLPKIFCFLTWASFSRSRFGDF